MLQAKIHSVRLKHIFQIQEKNRFEKVGNNFFPSGKSLANINMRVRIRGVRMQQRTLLLTRLRFAHLAPLAPLALRLKTARS